METISTENLISKSDVEQKVIYPLLCGGNFLAIDERNVRTKEYMAPSKIDKNAGKNIGHYPDYTIWDNSFPLMIVEAKRPDVAVDVGYREGTAYAQHLNQRYRTNVNPARFVMSCNGIRLLFGFFNYHPSIRSKRLL